MRDLQADLEICNKATPGPWLKTDDAQFIATAREGWPEAIERAIKAEEELLRLHEENSVLRSWKSNTLAYCGGDCPRVYGNEDKISRLAEENELQRQSIQDLSKQVVRLRAGFERIKTTIEEYHPHDTLTLPRFSFAKELHDIALAELEVHMDDVTHWMPLPEPPEGGKS